MIFIKHKIVN